MGLQHAAAIVGARRGWLGRHCGDGPMIDAASWRWRWHTFVAFSLADCFAAIFAGGLLACRVAVVDGARWRDFLADEEVLVDGTFVHDIVATPASHKRVSRMSAIKSIFLIAQSSGFCSVGKECFILG